MSDSVIEREALRAWAAGLIDADGARSGSVDGHRALTKLPSASRKRCSCGCKKRATHVGLGDGLALMSGCELRVRRWVRDGYKGGKP